MTTAVSALNVSNDLEQALLDVVADLANVRSDLTFLRDRLKSQLLVSGALRISGGSASPLVQTNATLTALANGVPLTKGSTNFPALVGTITNTKFNVFACFIDSTGTLSSAMGTEAATLAAVTFPAIPAGKAMVGYVVLNPTGTGNFVGGTTNLDDATVVPNVVFVNTLGAQDPKTALATLTINTKATP